MPTAGWYAVVGLVMHILLFTVGCMLRSKHAVYLSLVFGGVFIIFMAIGIIGDYIGG